MELSYWQSRWKKGHTGFHMEQVYPGLIKAWPRLEMPQAARVLVPLCGKSLDMIWLSSRAGKVTGVEISEKAVTQFLTEHRLEADRSRFGDFETYSAGSIELWCGDFLKFPTHKAGSPDLIYDKGALVALPAGKRERYARKLRTLASPGTKLLLHHFTYPPEEMNGPPFSIQRSEVEHLFGAGYDILELEKNVLNLKLLQKFVKRGLKSRLFEYLLLLSPKEAE